MSFIEIARTRNNDELQRLAQSATNRYAEFGGRELEIHHLDPESGLIILTSNPIERRKQVYRSPTEARLMSLIWGNPGPAAFTERDYYQESTGQDGVSLLKSSELMFHKKGSLYIPIQVSFYGEHSSKTQYPNKLTVSSYEAVGGNVSKISFADSTMRRSLVLNYNAEDPEVSLNFLLINPISDEFGDGEREYVYAVLGDEVSRDPDQLKWLRDSGGYHLDDDVESGSVRYQYLVNGDQLEVTILHPGFADEITVPMQFSARDILTRNIPLEIQFDAMLIDPALDDSWKKLGVLSNLGISWGRKRIKN